MKYAMKMVLIPESEYRRLKPEGGIKDKMNQILTGKHDHEAATNMTQMFGRYLRTTEPQPQIQSKLTKTQILTHLPPIYHLKVTKFLTYLENYGTSWTDKYELVLKNGQMIGNIIDLLKEVFVAKRGKTLLPRGWKKFIVEIVDANIPLNIFTKRSTKEDLHLEIKTREQKQLSEGWENF